MAQFSAPVARAGQRWGITRRRLEMALGGLWLLDGVLQLQSFMFTKEFWVGTLTMARMGMPGPAAHLGADLGNMITAHPAAWNLAFALLQLALGFGLLWRRSARLALALSVPWALGVWVIGEGFGGAFMSGTSLLTGAPGAAVIYAAVALLLWPDLPARTARRFGLAAWAAAWVGAALFELEAINRSARVPSAQIANGRFGEPGWLAWLDQQAGHLIGNHGAFFSVALGVVGAAVGLAVLWPRTRRPALIAGAVVGALAGLLGQDLGGLVTGHATDPGTGPLLVLLAVTVWSALPDRRTAAAPVHQDRPAAAKILVASVAASVALTACGSHETVTAPTTTLLPGVTAPSPSSTAAGPTTTAPPGASRATTTTTTTTRPGRTTTTTLHSASVGSGSYGTTPTTAHSMVTISPTSPTTARPSTSSPPTTARPTPTTAAPTTTAPPPPPHVTLTINNFAFSPSSLSIARGTEVTVVNDDTTTHTWTSVSGPAGFNSGNLNPGTSYSFIFTTAGTYQYDCSIHTFMTGSITVTG